VTADRGNRIEAQDARPADDKSVTGSSNKLHDFVEQQMAKHREHVRYARDLLGRQAWKTATGPDDPILFMYIRQDTLEEEQYLWLRAELVEQAARVHLARGAASEDIRELTDIFRGSPGVGALVALFDEVADLMAELSG
jgi:hypothetical protein